jgi:type III secretion system FlhB-like substrate exporter
MSSCCGFGRKSKGADTEPLLPRYEDDTALQRRLHQKLHTYQMIRALYKGYMPSTEQAIINLRTLLASDVLNPDTKDLSKSGRRLVRNSRELLKQFIELLQHKNSDDQIQDFLWYLKKSRVSLDLDDISHQASKAKAKADVSASMIDIIQKALVFTDDAAAYESLRTVGSLLLTNKDFRIFVDDLSIIGRQILSDTAFSLSGAAEQTAKKLEPSEEQNKTLKGPGADDGVEPSKEDVIHEAEDVSKVMANGVGQVGKDAVTSAKEHVSGEQKQTLVNRLKQTVMGLRKRTDYSDSVSTISKLIQRYAVVYSRAADATIATAQDDVYTNPALDRALRNFWSLLSRFGAIGEWRKLEEDFNKVMEHAKKDPEFEHFMQDVGNSVQKMLTDPEFLDHADEKLSELREKASQLGDESDFKSDLDRFFQQLGRTVRSVFEDQDISKLIVSTGKIFETLSPVNSITNPDLMTDSLNIFLPLLIRSIQNVPIPRLEVSIPEMDLLLENLIIEPGRTVNNTSFLPYRMLVTTRNDLEIRKSHSKRTVSSITSLITVSINGLSISAQDLGFWIRAHAGPFFRLSDEGIASFALDERGIDITLDLEVGRERLEHILTLRGVKVHIHKLDYALRKSKLSWLGWLFKPFLKHLIRRALEKTLAESIADFLHAANRELVFARERLRATRIADPQDIVTFVKAVMARLTPEEDPDVHTRVGVDAPDRGVFKNVYAPGSIVKLWHEEAMRAEEVVEDGGEDTGGWRNEIFDVAVY